MCIIRLCRFKYWETGRNRNYEGDCNIIEKAGFLVTPEDGSEELKSSDSFYISSQYLPKDTELQVGDQVEITYSGYIKEIYPALLEKITEVKILESGTEE